MSTATAQFVLATTEKVVYEKTISRVTIPTSAGEITVMPNHIPLVSTLRTGQITVTDSEGIVSTFAVAHGILEVRKENKIIILAGPTEPAEEIDVERAKEAYERAKQLLDEKRDAADVDHAHLQAMMDKQLNRINIAQSLRS